MMPSEKERLLNEIADLKKELEEMKKKLNFLEAVQDHYAKETAYFSNIETKIKDLFVSVNKRHNVITSLDYALRLYQNDGTEEKGN